MSGAVQPAAKKALASTQCPGVDGVRPAFPVSPTWDVVRTPPPFAFLATCE
jgi:hypothetical protein